MKQTAVNTSISDVGQADYLTQKLHPLRALRLNTAIQLIPELHLQTTLLCKEKCMDTRC